MSYMQSEEDLAEFQKLSNEYVPETSASDLLIHLASCDLIHVLTGRASRCATNN